jgi:hypothetical protein
MLGMKFDIFFTWRIVIDFVTTASVPGLRR